MLKVLFRVNTYCLSFFIQLLRLQSLYRFSDFTKEITQIISNDYHLGYAKQKWLRGTPVGADSIHAIPGLTYDLHPIYLQMKLI